jgi:hypothetical protein
VLPDAPLGVEAAMTTKRAKVRVLVFIIVIDKVAVFG